MSVPAYISAVPMNLLTTAQVRERLGVSLRRVQALIESGRLPAQKVGVQWFIEPKDLAKVKHRKTGRPRKKP